MECGIGLIPFGTAIVLTLVTKSSQTLNSKLLLNGAVHLASLVYANRVSQIFFANSLGLYPW